MLSVYADPALAARLVTEEAALEAQLQLYLQDRDHPSITEPASQVCVSLPGRSTQRLEKAPPTQSQFHCRNGLSIQPHDDTAQRDRFQVSLPAR